MLQITSQVQRELAMSEDLIEGDIGVYGDAVLDNFSCGISVISILTCGIVVYPDPRYAVFKRFERRYSVKRNIFPDSGFWSFLKQFII